MATTMNVACPDCGALNRLPAARLGESARATCGKCKARLFSGRPVAIADVPGFEKHIEKSDLPALVDFWAQWCGPCRMMAPEFETAAERLEPRVRLAKVDTEALPTLGSRYSIQAIPTMILFHRGRELARQSGAMQTAGIIRFAEAHLGKAAA